MQDGLIISALCFDGRGYAVEVEEEAIINWVPDNGTLWLHIDYSQPVADDFLLRKCKLDPLVAEALTEVETQPRCYVADDNLFLVLRGVNLNPDADLLDMVAIRAWIEPNRIITTRQRFVMAADDIRNDLQKGTGPISSEDFLLQLCDHLSRRMEIALSAIEDEEDLLEDQALEGNTQVLRSTISNLRRKIISVRRYLSPQRQVLSQLPGLGIPWLSADGRTKLREIANRTARDVDDLDAIRDRASVAQDELESRHSEQINKMMYLLSVVAAIFLPLGLITGLLGINVLGIPGSAHPYGFYFVCATLIAIAVFEIWLFRRIKLL